MDKPKFTPGPWKVEEDTSLIEDSNRFSTRASNIKYTALYIEEKDAHLIAAAPDMFEALEGICVDCLSDKQTGCWDGNCKVGLALYKARGE